MLLFQEEEVHNGDQQEEKLNDRDRNNTLANIILQLFQMCVCICMYVSPKGENMSKVLKS